jgi:RNA polymerase sigma-70 factor (ECF subfamily)
MVRDPDAAQTLTQECFLKAYQKRASFRGEASVGVWLLKIAVNLARDHRRSRLREFCHRLSSSSEDV